MTWSIEITRSELLINAEGLNGLPPLLEGEDSTRCEQKEKDLLPRIDISRPRRLHRRQENSLCRHHRRWLSIQSQSQYLSRIKEKSLQDSSVACT